MADLREVGSSNDPFSYWANSLKDVTRERNLSKSGDILLRTTHMGASISVHPKFKYPSNFMNYCGEWNPAAAYGVNDVVRVLPGVSYKLPISGTATFLLDLGPPRGVIPITTGTYTAQNGGSVITVSRTDMPLPGSYVCVCNVPSFATLPELTSINVIPTSALTLTSTQTALQPYYAFLNYLRLSDINYFPTWPELPDIAVFDPKDLTKTRGRYWELLSQLPISQSVCKDGAQKTIYVDAGNGTSGSYMYDVNSHPTFP